MKRIILFSSLLFSFVTLFSQTSLYENPRFDQIAKGHEIIAVIPFKAFVTLRPKQMKDITPEQLEKMEKAEGESIQNGMYSWFLRREKQGRLTVKVQNPATTNAKLKRADITIQNYEEYTPEEIANILEVDAVVMGTFETNKPMSEGASATLGILFGVFGSTNRAVLNLNIFNAADGETLVNYNKGISGTIGSTTEDLINILMRKASRRIAYTK